ncbi:MAG: type IV pilus secretin PilQ [Gammaproteobacteria bacterium]|nr:type IV pilus secretin PilQ [Gammaproteobacteria bacterium]
MGISTARAASTLEDITYSALPGDKVEITLHFSGAVPEPGSFTIDDPARIALDLPDTTLNLKEKLINVGIGAARNINAVDAGGRARVVINLTKLQPYETQRKDNAIVVVLGSTASTNAAAGAAKSTKSSNTAPALGGPANKVEAVDFRRGEKGEGRVIVTVSDPNTALDLTRRGDQVIVTLKNISLPDELERRLDVSDFATPVRTVDTMTSGGDVRLVLTGTGQFDHLAYQADNHITIDVKRLEKVKEEEEKKKKKRPDYTGERLSLNFQNIEVRAVLQLIADFTGVNMVTSDAVKGNVTLRLKNVPWDQALDIILKSKGLDKRQKGNVILVGPAAEIAAQEKLELEAQKQVKELAPIISESIQVNYAKATDMATLLKSKGNSLISDRGNITVDQRTNKLLVQDTAQNIAQIAALVEELDVPVRQVLIESRIVTVRTNFSQDLGVAWGFAKTPTGTNGTTLSTLGSISVAHDCADAVCNPITWPDTYNVNLGVSSPNGRIGLAIARLASNTLLDLELSASEAEGKSELISSPKVITSDQHKARILQGQEIPYLSSASSGAATISFKEAVLSLEVTPQITPDSRINMDLLVTKDAPDFSRLIFTGSGLGAPPINKQQVTTQVLVDNGETIVLGGVFEQTKSNAVNRVPFFADIPLLGAFFRNTHEQDDKTELLIFVTPKILKENIQL